MAIPMVRHFDSDEAEEQYYETHLWILIEYKVKENEIGKMGPYWSMEEDRVDEYDEFEIKISDRNEKLLTELFNSISPDTDEGFYNAENWQSNQPSNVAWILASDKAEADQLVEELEKLIPALDK